MSVTRVHASELKRRLGATEVSVEVFPQLQKKKKKNVYSEKGNDL